MHTAPATKSDPGPQIRFIDNGDGTVTDTKLGLMWSKETLRDFKVLTYEKAVEACKALGPEWRLPTRAELCQLVDDTQFDPAIDKKAFPDTRSGAYWASTEAASMPSFAWFVLFGYGNSGIIPRNSVAFVRAVRSLPAGTCPCLP